MELSGWVSIPFKRESASQLKAELVKDIRNLVSIPFKRDSASQRGQKPRLYGSLILSMVSIPFKRDSASQHPSEAQLSTTNKVSIPFKRESASQLISVYTAPTF